MDPDESSISLQHEVKSPINWLSLPTELWLKVFEYLPQSVLLFVVRHVCQFFRQIVFDAFLWQRIDMNLWKVNTTPKLLLENASHYHNFFSDELNNDLDLLSIEGTLQSSKIFIAITNRVHHVLSSLTFSRYEGDFAFGTEEQTVLFKCSNLTYLDASFCSEIDSNSLNKLSFKCVKLKTLILAGCSNVTDDAVKSICNLPDLETLNLCHCAGVTDTGLNHIMMMQARLKEFYCDGILHISDFGLIPFPQYQSEIRALSLDGEHLHDVSVVSVLTNLHNLNSFEMSFCSDLTDITISSFLRCANNRFQHLHLRQLSSSLNSSLIKQLFECDNMNLLTELSITDCLSVQDDTLFAVAQTCSLLGFVRFDWCVSITDDGVKQLVNSCSRLKKMMLVGLKRLLGVWLPGLELKLPQLVYLDLSQCDLISDDELRQLVTRKPDVIAYNYYHEEMSTQADNNPEPPSSSAGEAPCPASLGAFVDF